MQSTAECASRTIWTITSHNQYYKADILSLTVENTSLLGVYVITPARFGDHRGFFSESYSAKALAEHDITTQFVQDNHSLSKTQGTIRGLHFQAPPCAQDKLVRCGRGVLFDVAVDIRTESPTYGQWFGVELSFENGKQLLVPAGFAHGFVTRAPETEIIYKCSDYYAQETEGAVAWDDPQVGIDWGLGDVTPVLSDKDANAPALADLNSPFTFEGV
jgi:dTDP-4-dehydrorhamnose 3,5-epimerase